jgi:hypothetical protein
MKTEIATAVCVSPMRCVDFTQFLVSEAPSGQTQSNPVQPAGRRLKGEGSSLKEEVRQTGQTESKSVKPRLRQASARQASQSWVMWAKVANHGGTSDLPAFPGFSFQPLAFSLCLYQSNPVKPPSFANALGLTMALAWSGKSGTMAGG